MQSTGYAVAAHGDSCPREFPNWKTVYGIFLRCRNDGIWKRIHDTLRDILRCSLGRKKSPRAPIIDSQTTKTTVVGGQRGYDAGKKINGRKRRIVVHRADIQEYDGDVLDLRILGKLKNTISLGLKVIFADSAYGRNNPPELVKDACGWLLHTVMRPAGVRGFVALPKRWIVDRRFDCLGRYRWHSKDKSVIAHRVRQLCI
jgi:putative transposase